MVKLFTKMIMTVGATGVSRRGCIETRYSLHICRFHTCGFNQPQIKEYLGKKFQEVPKRKACRGLLSQLLPFKGLDLHVDGCFGA